MYGTICPICFSENSLYVVEFTAQTRTPLTADGFDLRGVSGAVKCAPVYVHCSNCKTQRLLSDLLIEDRSVTCGSRPENLSQGEWVLIMPAKGTEHREQIIDACRLSGKVWSLTLSDCGSKHHVLVAEDTELRRVT